MTHGSLFSGIGGFDYAAELMGWENIFHCELNKFAQKILKHYWPKAITYEDIKKTDFTIHRGRIDVLTGGFPCQPYSLAGKRKGKDDNRHLWPQMLRAIGEIKPSWVVGENVYGIINWGGGMVFNEVQADLEAQGYQVQPYILPACAKNAPHRRDRVWFIAHANSHGQYGNKIGQEKFNAREGRTALGNANGNGSEGGFTNTGLLRPEECQKQATGFEQFNKGNASNSGCRRQSSEEHRKKKTGWTSKESISNDWENFPTQSPICGGNDGLPTQLDGITFPKWRNESIKAYGNAIVPQVALEIFKTIEQYNLLKTCSNEYINL